MEYRREIDGLRAVAVLPVILFHARIRGFSGGYVGVDVFFVISGYLITSLLVAELDQGRSSIAGFYERRARRILPALCVVMLACLPFAWLWMLPYQLVEFAKSVVAVSVFSSNFLFWWEAGNYFGTANDLKPLLHTWSLAVEEQYYLLFPLSLMLAWRFGRRNTVRLVAGVAMISLALAVWGWRRHAGMAFYLAPFRGWELLLGAMLAFRAPVADNRAASTRSARLAKEGLALGGILLIAWAVVSFDDITQGPTLFTLVPNVGAALIIVFATSETLVGRMLSHRSLVGVGLVSYSAYLWHQPLFAFARIRAREEPGVLLFIGLAALSLVLAYFSWRFVEQPFRQRGRFSRASVFGGAGLMCVGMVCIGLVGQADNGFESRFPASDRYLVATNPALFGRYVSTRFRARVHAPFDRSKLKLLIIGDSFAEDFVNEIAENGYLGNASISTHWIAAPCGAIITNDDVTQWIPPARRASCVEGGRFEDAQLHALIHEADVVILAAAWRDWQAAYVAGTVGALRTMGAKQVLVVGTKNFGTPAPMRYVGLSDDAKRRLRNPVDDVQAKTNETMRRTLAPSVFIDVQALTCGEDASCPVFTDDLRLISFDGNHLTPDGARYVGRRVFQHPELARIIERASMNSGAESDRTKP